MSASNENPLSARELLKKVRRIEIITRRLVQDQMAGSYHSVFKGRGMSFDEVRPYQQGDEVRLIDWNVTARTGDPYVKEFVEERELNVVIAVDVSSSMSTGSGASSRRDVAAEIAATVALSAIHNGDRVGLLLFAEGFRFYIPPKRTKGHGLRVIREVLAATPPTGAGTNLQEAMAYLGLILKRRSVVFLVSDFLEFDGMEKEIRTLARRHDIIPLHVRDPLEIDPPEYGALMGEDPEKGVRRLLPFGFSSYRNAFAEAVRAQIAQVEQTFQRAGTSVVPVNLGESPIRPMLRYFKLRAKGR